MPIYKQGPTEWRLKVWHLGTPHAKIFHGTRREALAAEAAFRLEVEARAGAPGAEAAPTFLRFCLDDYIPAAKLRLRPSWLRNTRYIVATLIEHFGDQPIDELDIAGIETFAGARIDDGVSPVTVNGELRVLRRILSVAVEREKLEAVPKVAAIPEPEKTIDVWSQADLGKLLDACATKERRHILGMVAFLANTGCRRGEALALRWEHVDLERGLVKIWPSSEWQPKGKKPREVPIAAALRPWLELPRRSAYVFPTFHGRGKGGRRKSWPARAFDEAVEAAGLKGTAHKLRHTFAAHFLSARPDLTLLAEILGHTDTEVTRLYKHLLPDHLARARGAVEVVAPAAAAEALAMERWRADRAKPSRRPSRATKLHMAMVDDSPNDSRGAGYRVRTGDIKLGKIEPRSNLLELLKR